MKSLSLKHLNKAFFLTTNTYVGVTDSPYIILENLIEEFGQGKVFFSAFSVTDQSINSIFDLYQSGKILKLECLIDYSNLHGKADFCFQLESIALVKYAPVHAKIIMLETDNETFIVTGSANLQVKNRIELIHFFRGPEALTIGSEIKTYYEQL